MGELNTEGGVITSEMIRKAVDELRDVYKAPTEEAKKIIEGIEEDLWNS